MKSLRNIRLFVEQNLELNSHTELSEKQSHYLANVMRCQSGEQIYCFNGKNGEFLCRLENVDKKRTKINVLEQTKKLQPEPDIWLLFAPLKKDKTDFVIEKATELGISKIQPVITRYTNSDKVKTDRFIAQATEASEQCGRLSVPEIAEPIVLEKLLTSWDDKRLLFFLDERRQGASAAKAFTLARQRPAAVLIGPEGGFDEAEAKLLNQCPFVKNVSLGPRILRAETASLSALAVWQAVAGDWVLEKE